MKRPFEVQFIGANEIRMGSPFNICKIELLGKANIHLPVAGWQDKCAWSADNKYLLLIKWNVEQNEPGFHLMIYNILTGMSIESERIFGLLNTVTFEGNKILYNKFLYTSRNADGTLNGYSDHEYGFEPF